MPRPVKCRKVCHFPNVLEFLPADNAEKKVPIVLTVDAVSYTHLEQKEKLVSYAERHYQTMSNVIFQALDILYAR